MVCGWSAAVEHVMLRLLRHTQFPCPSPLWLKFAVVEVCSQPRLPSLSLPFGGRAPQGWKPTRIHATHA